MNIKLEETNYKHIEFSWKCWKPEKRPQQTSNTLLEVCPALAKITEDYTNVFSLTVTLNPRKWEISVDPKVLHLRVSYRLRKIFRIPKKYGTTQYLLFPEYHKNGVLHYHGYLKIDSVDRVLYYQAVIQTRLTRKIGLCQVKNMNNQTINQKTKWKEYIQKDYEKMTPIKIFTNIG